MNATKGLSLLALCAAAIVTIAGCQTPYQTGLTSTIGLTGTSSTTSVYVETVPSQMAFEGSFELEEGTLIIRLRAPSGDIVFDRAYEAVSSGQIAEELVPEQGEWTISVWSPGGRGTYSVRLLH